MMSTNKSSNRRTLDKATLRKKFHAAGMRMTRQRVAILRELVRRSDHPSVNDLVRALRSRFPRLSLFSVYRTINIFEAAGLIHRVALWKGCVRYDGLLKPHAHFLCRKCGRIIDLDWSDQTRLCQILVQELGQVHQVNLLIHGEENDCFDRPLDDLSVKTAS